MLLKCVLHCVPVVLWVCNGQNNAPTEEPERLHFWEKVKTRWQDTRRPETMLLLLLLLATSYASLPPDPASLNTEDACLQRCTGLAPPQHAPSDALGPCSQFGAQGSVFGMCEMGAAKGARSGCVQGCRGGGARVGGAFCFGADAASSPGLADARAGACAALQQAAPRPLAWDACQHGFNAGVQSACAASHHWALGEAARREAARAAAAAAAEAAALAEVEAQVAARFEAEAQRARAAAAAAAEAAAAARRAAGEREAAAAAEREKKRGKVRGK
jgi:hypothetical protein